MEGPRAELAPLAGEMPIRFPGQKISAVFTNMLTAQLQETGPKDHIPTAGLCSGLRADSLES